LIVACSPMKIDDCGVSIRDDTQRQFGIC